MEVKFIEKTKQKTQQEVKNLHTEKKTVKMSEAPIESPKINVATIPTQKSNIEEKKVERPKAVPNIKSIQTVSKIILISDTELFILNILYPSLLRASSFFTLFAYSFSYHEYLVDRLYQTVSIHY